MNYFYAFAILLFPCSYACSQGNNSTAHQQNNSVEDREPNSDYSPAFTGQTRIGKITTSTKYEIKIISDDLSRPWGIACMPDGRFLITENQATW